MSELLYREESFQIIGCCLEVHRELSKGHDEVIYKDALEVEFGLKEVTFSRETEFTVAYKGIVLSHKFFADFVVSEKVILEAKAVERLSESHVKQVLNYLAAARLRLGLLVNFGEDSLTWKRVVL